MILKNKNIFTNQKTRFVVEEDLFSIAFYNTENLFDYKNDKHTLDSDYTPGGRKKWGHYRYQHKVNKIAKVISKIGTDSCMYPPTLIGLAEIETKQVALDIIHCETLRYLDYDCIHYESPDERGIDVALLYHKDFFKLHHSEPIPVNVFETTGIKDDTRDILYVKGELHGEPTHVFVNHWPSRRKGIDKTHLKRIALAQLLSNKISQILEQEPDAKLLIMGDFNDDPFSESLQKHLLPSKLQNPMKSLLSNQKGSLIHNGTWHLFDQILHSNSFIEKGNQFVKAKIFNKEFLTDWTGRNKGEPLRTYIGKFYRGGFSDHFPVFSIFRKKTL
ncbi:endonuclease/exonuclease/phosphatase family protein [Ochrovirga pacifica]|uniref:endonuclease/exonuclease/phosphatase family protein n=1 Tax=Ochrovirga pacifica TaxID=1042376 RepID=UPI000255A4ED|nr:endonuclease/exonuclease/phosphatase family protein [Ochrovirga pacifica]